MRFRHSTGERLLADQLSRQLILVVDDEPAVRQMTRRVLEAAGYRVLEADSGAGALGILERDGVDAVITDMRMPGMTGEELAAHLVLMTPHLPILFVSGWEEHLDSAVLAGPVLAKPFRADQLIGSIREMLSGQTHLT